MRTLGVYSDGILPANAVSARGFSGALAWRSVCFVLALSLSLAAAASAFAGTILLDEDYDELSPGEALPNWRAWSPGQDATLPVVQQISFSSAPNGAEVNNDFIVARDFDAPVEGILTIEIWMNPRLGSDTNNFLFFYIADNVEGIIGKNETDMWMYFNSNVTVPFMPVDGSGHNIRIVYDTSTAGYDLYFDEALIIEGARNGNIGQHEGKPLKGLAINSGRGGIGRPSYFDDLRVTLGLTDVLCDVVLNRSDYIDGDMIIAVVERLANFGDQEVAVEIKGWFDIEGLGLESLVNIGADGTFLLAPGFDTDYGPANLRTVNPEDPRGTHKLVCRLLDPVTGEHLYTDINEFKISNSGSILGRRMTKTWRRR